MIKDITRVFPVAMEKRYVDTLKIAFKARAHGACVICEEHNAQVALIDLDKNNAEQYLADFQKANPNIPIVALSANQPTHGDLMYVSKPISVMNLVASLQEMATMKHSNPNMNKVTPDKIERAMKAIEAAKAANSLGDRINRITDKKVILKNNISTKSDNLYYDPAKFLIGKIFEAIGKLLNTEHIAILDCWNGKKIIIDSHTHMIYSELSDSQIRTMSIALDHELNTPINIEYLNKDQLKNSINKTNKQLLRSFNHEIFMWNLALITCGGRLPPKTDLNETFYFARWPNLTRLQLTPNAMRIVAYWVNQPSSLTGLSNALNLPEKEVFTIYSAASAAGLAGLARRESDNLLQTETPEPHKKRGIFSSIIHHLGKHIRETEEAVA